MNGKIKIDYQSTCLEIVATPKFTQFKRPLLERTILASDLSVQFFGERLESFFSPVISLEVLHTFVNYKNHDLIGVGKFQLDFYFFSVGFGPVFSSSNLGANFSIELGKFMESKLALDSVWVSNTFINKLSFQHRMFDNLYFTNYIQFNDKRITVLDQSIEFKEIQYLAGFKYYFFDTMLFGAKGGVNLDNTTKYANYVVEGSLGLFFITKKKG